MLKLQIGWQSVDAMSGTVAGLEPDTSPTWTSADNLALNAALTLYDKDSSNRSYSY